MRMSPASITKTIGILLLAVLLSSCGYNQLQREEEAVFKAAGDLESALQRRADLIPNLVEVVKGVAKQEQQVLIGVTEARSKAGQVKLGPDVLSNPQAMGNVANAQGELSSALSRLMVVVEQYPELKSNQNFLDLQHQLEGTENRINVARTRYNEAVERFNADIRTFPNSLTNNVLLHLQRKEFFKAAETAKAAPQVKF